MKVIAYDLDGTLLNSNGTAASKEIKKLSQLFEDPDNFIVIYTARSYSLFHKTRRLLMSLEIKHHALVMEKLRASEYIDDKARKP